MNAALTEKVRYEFLSWINEQLRQEVQKRAETQAVAASLTQLKWISRLHTALVAGLSFVSITVLVCMHC